MKLLYVTKTFPYGTGEAFLIAELRELIKQGQELTIIPLRPQKTLQHKNINDLLDLTLTQPLLSVEIIKIALGVFAQQPRAVWQGLKTIFKSRNMSVFLKNLMVFPKGLWLAAQLKAGQFEHLHAHWISTPASMALIAADLTNTPWSITAHRSDIVLNNLLQVKTDSAQFVRYISISGLELAKNLGLKSSNSFVLHMGVSLASLKEKLSDKKNAQSISRESSNEVFHILCPANLVLVKGHRYLFEALKLLKDKDLKVFLSLAGKGELELELKEQVTMLGLSDQVRFLGHLAHEDLLALYAEGKVDAVVLPSIDLGGGLHEGIPVSLIEAMSYGVSVISTKTGGIPELLAEAAGILVAQRDSLGLVEAIEKLMLDAELKQTTSKKAKEIIESKFAIQTVVAELLEAMKKGRC